MNNLYKPFAFGDTGTTLKKALKENPYNPERGNEAAYCRYLRYRVEGFYTKTNREVKEIWKTYTEEAMQNDKRRNYSR